MTRRCCLSNIRQRHNFLQRVLLVCVLILSFSCYACRAQVQDQDVQHSTDTAASSAAEYESSSSSFLNKTFSAPDNKDDTTKTSNDKAAGIIVDDHFSTLSNTELESICKERGFEIESSQKDGPPSRQDYIDAARRCITLEKEMNAILAEHPELAAELDKEVERMRNIKESLEKERAEMLVLKAQLEQKLQQASPGNVTKEQAHQNVSAVSAHYVPLTFKAVLVETFKELYQRVRADIKFVGRLLEPILKPLGHALRLVWQQSKPFILKIFKETKELIKKLRTKVGSDTPNSSSAAR